MKYFKWLGIGAVLTVIVGCFLPWIEILSVHMTVTGVDPAGTNFGRPGKAQIFLAVLSLILFFIPRIWARRTNLFIAAFAIAWAFRNIIIYSRCEMGECPQKGLGIWMVMLGSALVLISAIFQDLKLKPAATPQSTTGKD